MFIFGHTGIGRTIAAPFARGLSDVWFMTGAILPDLIDKSLYYGMSVSMGLRAGDLGLISGTRTVGHTGLVMLVFAALGLLLKHRGLAALSLGSATHLLLDAFMDLGSGSYPWDNGVVVAIFFPFAGFRFPITPHAGAGDHALSLFRTEIVITETIGLFLLCWHFWKTRHENAVVRDAREFARAIRKRFRWRRV